MATSESLRPGYTLPDLEGGKKSVFASVVKLRLFMKGDHLAVSGRALKERVGETLGRYTEERRRQDGS